MGQDFGVVMVDGSYIGPHSSDINLYFLFPQVRAIPLQNPSQSIVLNDVEILAIGCEFCIKYVIISFKALDGLIVDVPVSFNEINTSLTKGNHLFFVGGDIHP